MKLEGDFNQVKDFWIKCVAVFVGIGVFVFSLIFHFSRFQKESQKKSVQTLRAQSRQEWIEKKEELKEQFNEVRSGVGEIKGILNQVLEKNKEINSNE